MIPETIILSALTIAVLIAAPIVAHIAGWWASRALRVKPGAIREWMPSIPDHLSEKGRAEARWERRRRSVERKLLQKFDGGVAGAEAQTLAAELGEDPEVVAGALGHMREEIPARLRVTKSGKLLHDFTAESINALKSRRRMTLPARFAIFTLGALANLGAAWPVVMGLLVGGGALGMIATGASAEVVGGSALALIAVLFVANLAGGWLTHLLLTPGFGLLKLPKLGPTKGAESESFGQLENEQAAGWAFWSASSSDRRNHKSSSSGGCDGADLGEGGAAIIVLLLVVVVAACTFALFVYLRGIWRAATGAGMPPLDVSPTQWVRSTQPDDSWERFIPTNDLVLRVMRVLRRLVSHTHPRDSGIIGRVMAKAKAQGGRIAALEIALQEGLDLDEATTIGARLSGRADGRIDVTDDGEIDFVFPAESLTDAPAEWDQDLNAEYLDYRPKNDSIGKRQNHEMGKLPVNLPGISFSHVKSGSRLAAGTVLMMMTGVFAVAAAGFPIWVQVLVDSFLPLLALGTFALAGVLRYVTASMAALGVRRDIRRMGFLQIRRRLSIQLDDVKFETIVDPILNVLGPAWKGLDRDLIAKELTAVAIDLDLEPLDGDLRFSVKELSERLSAIEAYRATAPDDVVFDLEDDEQVIFDSHIEHDRIRALA